jgi:hypothetical protein
MSSMLVVEMTSTFKEHSNSGNLQPFRETPVGNFSISLLMVLLEIHCLRIQAAL